MEQHAATEAPKEIIETDGTHRLETEQERITRIQTAMQSMEDRAYRRPLPGSIDLAAYLVKSDYRPGDIVDVFDPKTEAHRTAECSGRDNDNIYVRYHDTNTQNRVHYTQLTMLSQGIGHGDAPLLITPPANLPTRAEAAAEFAEAIIQTAPLASLGSPGVSIDGIGVEDLPPLTPLPIQLLHTDAQVPTQARAGDAGYDLHSTEAGTLQHGERKLIGTGIAVAIPLGYVGFIKPRSGLAHKHGINVLGGVIDAGYRGEVKVILHSTGGAFKFAVGDRIAQLVIQPVASVRFQTTETLPDSERSEGGFGSTGA